MTTAIDKYTAHGCAIEDRHKVCRSRGGESCAFDGAMIVLQPIKDAAHVVHGPIACCGNSWEGRGTLARYPNPDDLPLTRMGFTTDMTEIDIVYGSEEKLYKAILRAAEKTKPKAVFVYATCVSGLIGEDLDAVCSRAEANIGMPVIAVNAPGFTGPKNLGNRIAGEVLLDRVIGTDEPPVQTHYDINLIGEYNIAGDLWRVEPLLSAAGFHVLSRITGDATFEEIAWAHRAKLNVVVCGRALINVAHEMERRYGIPFVEVSFFGTTEIARALRMIHDRLSRSNGFSGSNGLSGSSGLNGLNDIESLIAARERKIAKALQPYRHLRGKKAVLYTGGVKSWSFISALRDLGIEVVAVGTKKSTFEDEEKMKQILGPGAPLVEDVTPKNLLNLLKDRQADILIAGGRNQYLAIKEGYPFVDVNQERHEAYAGYDGLVNLAKQISNGLKFYDKKTEFKKEPGTGSAGSPLTPTFSSGGRRDELRIDPLKHSPAIGAAMAIQGIHNALPVIHAAQGCGFLGKVLLTKHFREPIALATSKLFVEDVVMGSEERLAKTVRDFADKNTPDLIAVLTSGLTEVKGDDVGAAVRNLEAEGISGRTRLVQVPTPDYDGGLETGYAKAVEEILKSSRFTVHRKQTAQVTLLAGSHLTPGDVNELREIVESFGLRPLILPDLSALDGSREGFSGLAKGGTTLADIEDIGSSLATIVIGRSMKGAANIIAERFGTAYTLVDGLSGLEDSDRFMQELGRISNRPLPARYQRQRRMLVDGMRDGQVLFGSKRVCLALEPDHGVQMSRWLLAQGARIPLAMLPTTSDAASCVAAERVEIGDLFAIRGEFDLLIANSHAREAAKRLHVPLYHAGFPVFGMLGYAQKVMIGYRGTLALINDVGSLLMKQH